MPKPGDKPEFSVAQEATDANGGESGHSAQHGRALSPIGRWDPINILDEQDLVTNLAVNQLIDGAAGQ